MPNEWLGEKPEFAIQGDTCGVVLSDGKKCGYVYQEGERIHEHKEKRGRR